MKWMLILIIFNANRTPTITTIVFPEKFYCVTAMDYLREHPPTKAMAAYCFATGEKVKP